MKVWVNFISNKKPGTRTINIPQNVVRASKEDQTYEYMDDYVEKAIKKLIGGDVKVTQIGY